MANTNLCTAVTIPPAVSESHQPSEPPAAAAATPAATRPSLHRRNCFVAPEPDGPPTQPQSSGSESDSEGYETAPEDTEPASTMAEKRAPSCSEGRVRRSQDLVSSPMSDSDSVQTTLTNTQIKDHSDAATAADANEEEVEAIHRRNIKMRDEGVRVTINSSQLSSLKALPAPRLEPTHMNNTSGSPPQAPSTSPSSSSSNPSTSPSLAGLQSPTPAPTPADNDIETVTTTPDHHHHQGVVLGDAAPAPSVLPSGGGHDAEVWLDHLGERLLAVPADPVSRRALRDGRAMLFGGGRGRRPRAALSAAEARRSPDRPDMRAGWYPSELME